MKKTNKKTFKDILNKSKTFDEMQSEIKKLPENSCRCYVCESIRKISK